MLIGLPSGDSLPAVDQSQVILVGWARAYCGTWQVWQASLSVCSLSLAVRIESVLCGFWPWQDWQVAALNSSTLPRMCNGVSSLPVGV